MNQSQFDYLRSKGFTGDLNDMLVAFYKSQGAVGNELKDLEYSFLASLGFSIGAVQDRWKAYLTSIGYTGALQDALVAVWRAGTFPVALLTDGTQGWWYDPSDMSTLFQDAAGTTPVTAVEQPVGLMRDKSGMGNHATQATSTSRPILRIDSNGCYYLDADGSDDGMATPAFAAGSDKLTAFAAIYKATDSLDQQTIMEFGANSASTAGTFAIQSSPALAPQIRFQLYGSSRGVRDTLSEFAAPRKMVISCAYGISGATITDEVKPRINGVAPTLNTILTPAGTGSFGTHSLNLFRRNATNLPFQGRFYGGAGKFKSMTDQEIKALEFYFNTKCKAF